MREAVLRPTCFAGKCGKMRETVVTQINMLFDLQGNAGICGKMWAGNCVAFTFSPVFPQIENVRIGRVSCLDSSAFIYDTACA